MRNLVVAKEVVTVEDLQAALVEINQTVKLIENRPRFAADEILVSEGAYLILEQEKLSDGSHVYNLRMSEKPSTHNVYSRRPHRSA